MKVTFNRNDLTENVEARAALIRIMSDAKHGGFMRIHAFQSKTGYGEIQNATYQKGISYGEAVKRSLAMLDAIEADPSFEATVTRGIWLEQGLCDSADCNGDLPHERSDYDRGACQGS